MIEYNIVVAETIICFCILDELKEFFVVKDD